ncbi:MAG: hypothetical protein AAGC55_27830, partial [Myxococcota bacterium]
MENKPDPRLVELVSQRMNLSVEEVAALNRGDIQSVIASRFAGDPRAQVLLQLARQGASSSEPEQGSEPVAPRPAEQRSPRRAAQRREQRDGRRRLVH